MADAPHIPHGGLNKKIGPLPAKAWAGIAVVGVIGGLYIRSHGAASSSAANTPTDPNIDPATGLTYAEEAAQQQAAQAAAAPAGATGSGDLSPLPTIDPSLSTLPALDTSTIDPGTGDTSSGDGTAPGDTIINIGAPNVPVAARHVQPKLTTKGAKRAPSGPTKPRAPKGFTTRGLGGGNWEFVPAKLKPRRPANPPKKPRTAQHPTVSHRKTVTGHRPSSHTTPAHHPAPKPRPKPAPRRGRR